MFTFERKGIIEKIYIKLLCIVCAIGITTMFSYSMANEKLNIYAQSYIAFDRITGKVMFGKNIDKKVPMASTTKIMTAILTIEYGKLNEYVIATQNAQNVTGWQLNLKKGDKILLNDLLYAIMLYSANDGAIAIAEHIGGSVENFCKMMNQKAKQIGAYNTNFTSPHGLDNDMHYSTPYDLALIMNYALDIGLFRDIISTHSYVININGYNRTLNNTNKLVKTLDGCIGGKTGYTGKAGYCLVNNCKNKNMDVIGVVLGAGTTEQRFSETKQILEYAIRNYEIINLSDYINDNISIRIDKCSEPNIIAKHIDNISIPILKQDKEKISIKYHIVDNLTLPIAQNTVLGYVQVLVQEKEIMKLEYVTQKEYKKHTYIYYIKFILGNYINLLKIE